MFACFVSMYLHIHEAKSAKETVRYFVRVMVATLIAPPQ